ncbi:MAG: tetratricopeptide repeat protein [Myxococcales bacterium]|nr:MAG: tetratricopeptide repeat protein [Myxococcales bacterium]
MKTEQSKMKQGLFLAVFGSEKRSFAALFARTAVVTLCLVTVACGGSDKKESAKKDSIWGSGDESTDTALSDLSAETQRKWKHAKELFIQYEKEGWSDSACSSTSSAFEDASSSRKGGFAEALFMAGLSKERCGDSDDAKDFYEKTLSLNPKFCKARVGIGVMQMREGKRSDALVTFSNAIKDDARCTEGYVNLATLQRDSARTSEQYKEALDNLRRGLAIDANYLPAFNQMALLYLDLAKKDKKLLDLAEVVCRQAQQINDKYAPIYNTWGQINLAQDKIIEAAAKFRYATELDPKFFEAYMNFGEITLSYRGYDDAKAAFEKAALLRSNSYDAHLGLGAALRGLKQFDAAEKSYKQAQELDSRRPESYFNLGVLYQNYKGGSIDDFSKAKDYFEEFLDKAKSGGQFAESVDEVRRRCQTSSSRRKRKGGKSECQPGRLQNIEQALAGLREAAKMQSGGN